VKASFNSSVATCYVSVIRRELFQEGITKTTSVRLAEAILSATGGCMPLAEAPVFFLKKEMTVALLFN